MMKSAFSNPLFDLFRREWNGSKGFRWLAAGSLVYLLLRLGMQMALLFDPASQEIAADLQTYLNAASAFQQHQALYLPGALNVVNFYQYAPFYALTFIPFLWLSPLGVAVVHTLLHLAAYGLLYLAWGRIFHHLELEKAERWMLWSLPVWVVFSGFWGDLAYLNIYLIVALLATLLIESVLKEQLGWSAVWLVLLLQVKPHWAFAALVPLLMGRRAFFLKLMGLAAAGYAATVLVTVAAGGGYAWQQYVEYFRFLPRLSASFPWRGPESGFLGYNHSVKQVVVFWLGVTPGTLALADAIKLALLIPLGWIAVDSALGAGNRANYVRLANGVHLANDVRLANATGSRRFLDLTFALYLGAFLWLDMVWELSLGTALFVYLLATLESRWSKGLAWAVFLLYALIDFWQLASYLAFGPQILVQDAYVATDPSMYAPVILLVILVFYGILVKRLWAASAQPRSKLQWNLKRS